MTSPRRFPPRARTRAILLASAVMAGLLAVVLWYSASTMELAGSPVDPEGQVLDRAWDTRRLGAAVVMFNIALVALFAALVPPSNARPDPHGETEASGDAPVQEVADEN